MSDILKLFSRFTGKTLISFSLTIFILTFFAIPLAENVDVIGDSLDTEVLLKDMVKDSGVTLEEARELCQKNPEQEECDVINDPSSLLDEQLKPITEKAQEIKPQLFTARIISIIIFIVGIILLFIGTSNIYETAYKTSSTTFFTSLFYAVFYKLADKTIPGIAGNISQQDQEVPKVLLDMAVKAITEWIKIPIKEVFTVCLILIGVSLIVLIPSYILRKKHLKKDNSSKEKD